MFREGNAIIYTLEGAFKLEFLALLLLRIENSTGSAVCMNGSGRVQ